MTQCTWKPIGLQASTFCQMAEDSMAKVLLLQVDLKNSVKEGMCACVCMWCSF